MSGREVVAVRGDADDVFSKGFLCPKATGLEHLQADPDRLRAPLVKQPDGTFAEAGWDEALEIVDARLSPCWRSTAATPWPCTWATRTPTTCPP